MSKLNWKASVPTLFAEILGSNDNMWIMKQPLIIVDGILREGANRAMELKDEKMVSIFARLGMYEGCTDTTHPDHNRLMELTNKRFDANRGLGLSDNSNVSDNGHDDY